MADGPVSGLTPASTLDGTETEYVVQGGNDRKATKTQTKTFVNTGTTTNDNAANGQVGEYVSNSVPIGSAAVMVSGTAQTVQFISLTAGDWDVTGYVAFLPANTTSVTQIVGSISTVNNTLNTTPGQLVVLTIPANIFDGATQGGVTLPSVRISLAATTTIYLVGQSTFSIAGNKVFGMIRARRVR